MLITMPAVSRYLGNGWSFVPQVDGLANNASDSATDLIRLDISRLDSTRKGKTKQIILREVYSLVSNYSSV
jgi:hypothetical protein